MYSDTLLISRLLFRRGNSVLYLHYFVLAGAITISLIAGHQALDKGEMTPYLSTGIASSIYPFLAPIFMVSLFHGTVSGMIEGGTMKRMLMVPTKKWALYSGAAVLVTVISLLISALLVIPESVVSFFVSNNQSYGLLIRSLLQFFPTLTYTISWGLLVLLVSYFTRSNSSSLILFLFLFVITSLFSPLLVTQFTHYIVSPSGGFKVGSAQYNEARGFLMGFFPFESYSSSISILAQPYIVTYSIFGVLSYNLADVSSVQSSLFLSFIPLTLTSVEIPFLIVIGLYRNSRLRKLY